MANLTPLASPLYQDVSWEELLTWYHPVVEAWRHALRCGAERRARRLELELVAIQARLEAHGFTVL